MTTPTGLIHLADGMTGYTEEGNSRANALDSMINVVLSVAMSDADLTLTLAQAQSAHEYRVTGTLTASRKLVFPGTIPRACSVVNATAGGQSITVGYATGTAVTIPAAEGAFVVGDGTNFAVRATGNAATAFAIEKDGTQVAATATALNFIGDITVVQNGNKVDITPGDVTSGIAVQEGSEAAVAAVTTVTFDGAFFDVTDNADGSVNVALKGGGVDALGNPTGALFLAFPIYLEGVTEISQGTGLDFFEGFSVEAVLGSIGRIRTSFLLLPDTPSSYADAAGKVVAVNGSADGLVFVDAAGGSTAFTSLTDTPANYTDQGGKFVAVNGGGTALEFVDAPSGSSADGASMTRTRTVTSAPTHELADAGGIIEIDSASDIEVALPSDATVAYPVGTVIHYQRRGTGAVTFAAGAGATLEAPPDGFTAAIAAQRGHAAARKRASNTWALDGRLGASA